MIEDKNKKKNKVIKGIALLGLFLMVFGISYALFKVTLNGNKTNRIKTGSVDVILTDKNGVEEKDLPDGSMGVNIERAVPMSADEGMALEPYEFNIENRGSIDMVYSLYLNASVHTLPANKIKYSLQRTDTPEILSLNHHKNERDNLDANNNTSSYYNSTLLSDANVKEDNGNKLFRIDIGVIKSGEKCSYKLNMWVAYAASTEINDKEFQAVLRVDASQENKEEVYPVKRVYSPDIDHGRYGYTYLYSDGSLHIYRSEDWSVIFDYDFSSVNEKLEQLGYDYTMNSVNDYELLWQEYMDGNISEDDWDEIELLLESIISDPSKLIVDPLFNGVVYYEEGTTDIGEYNHSPGDEFKKYIKEIYIPTSITVIKDDIITNMENLEKIEFYDTEVKGFPYQIIKQNSIHDNQNLTTFKVPTSVTTIYNNSIYNCPKLNLELPRKFQSSNFSFTDIKSISYYD